MRFFEQYFYPISVTNLFSVMYNLTHKLLYITLWYVFPLRHGLLSFNLRN